MVPNKQFLHQGHRKHIHAVEGPPSPESGPPSEALRKLLEATVTHHPWALSMWKRYELRCPTPKSQRTIGAQETLEGVIEGPKKVREEPE